MTATVIDGVAAAARLRAEVAEGVQRHCADGRPPPGLVVVIVGDNPASRAYVRTKATMAKAAGIAATLVELPATTGTAELLEVVDRLNVDPLVDGILVQLPLPETVDAERVLDRVVPEKDVDGFHPLNVGRLFAAQGRLPADLLVPCTPRGCLRLLEETLGAGGLRGRHAVVVGRSNIVGKPMAALLLLADCTVTVAHSRTPDLPAMAREADILVAAVGRPELVTAGWVKPGAVVIDVGINRVTDTGGSGRLVGDVAYAEVAAVAGAITPVPGGVGPMTVACLLQNSLIAARARSGG